MAEPHVRGRLRRPLDAVAAVGVGGVLATAAYGLISTQRFRVREETVPVLPPGAPALRILHISDIHLVPGQEAKIRWLRSLAKLEPDLVVNTGDNLSDEDAVGPLLGSLRPLMDFPGVFVPGSNCYFAPRPRNPLDYLLRQRDPGEKIRHRSADELDWRRMHTGFAAGGWQDATNRALTMTVRGLPLEISGVDDPHLQRDEFPGWPSPAPAGGAMPDAAGSPHAAGSPDAGAAPRTRDGGAGARRALRLGLAHAPYRRVLDDFARTGADLILAGHTHGGQLALPRYGALVSNCTIPAGMASGLSWWESDGHRSALHVSAGIGTSRMAPLRTWCPPEAVLLTLTPRPA